jgi:hypothetical protein
VDAGSALDTVLLVLLIVLAGAGIVAAVALVRTLGDTRALVAELRERLVPLIDKADVTLDAVNAELLRVDSIVSQVEEVSETVSAATGFIRSPVNKAAEVGARLIGGLRSRRK